MNGKALIFLCLFYFLRCTKAFNGRGYIVTSPSVFRSNIDHVINVRIFNHNEEVRVNAKLVDSRENLIVSVSTDISNSGNLTLKVPPGLEGRATLRICGNCHLNNGFRFQNDTSVTLLNKGSSAFLQTDKPVYKPGQTVYLNVFLVNRDLKPVKENVTVYVVAPNDARVIQWKNLQPVCCGVINISFPLSDQPVLGQWVVYAEIDRNAFNSTFEVQKYVLPKFEVSIIPPPFFRQNCEDIEVRAMYVFGKPVLGRLEVNMSVHGVDYSRTHFMDISSPILRQMRINGRERIPVCLDQLLSEDVNPHFRGYLHIQAKVVSEDGSEFTAFDESTPVSREKVDIDFTFDTRSHFKPGLPFVGKISSTFLDGSKAAYVTIHLVVKANRENFFNQDLVSDHHGIAAFTVPAVLEDTWFMIVKAQIVAVGGRRVGHHGGTITRYLHNWYSPSNCHILAEGPGEALQVNNDAQVLVKSNCPCNFTLFYEILSRGNIVQSGSNRMLPSSSENISSRRRRAVVRERAHPLEILEVESNENIANSHVCRTSIPIHVTADMAPTSRMLVYYVKDDGEGIADSINLLVEPELENEVEILTSQAETSPGSDVTVSVTSEPDSCVCLAVVDRSVHLMKPGYRINREQIFEEMRDYDLDNSPYQDIWSSAVRAKRSGNHWWEPPQSRDAKHAFLESGLVVMTNAVSLNYKRTTQIFTHLVLQSMTQAIRTESQKMVRTKMNKVATKKRTFFPETWIWSCFNTSTNQQNFTLRVPDSVTTWQADAISLNPQSGIGVSNPTRLQSVKNFFMDFNLPYSVIRGEAVEIPLTTYNYLNVCVEASVRVDLPAGVEFVDLEARERTTNICIQPQTTETTRINLQFSILGHKSLEASVEGFAHSSRCCGETEEVETLVASDHIERKILVEAEGMKRNYAQSVYFCPNERINISTSSSRSFQFVRLPSNDTFGFDFLVKASHSVHIILSQEERITDQSFEIVLGGENNQRSWISRGSNQILRAHIDRILSEDSFQPFWISWAEDNIQVGTGSTPSSISQFMYTRQSESETRGIRFIGFATSDGATGEFRLWQKEVGNEQNYFQQLIALTLPTNIVQNSARGTASLIADVMGPTLKNLNNLLSLPFGCGEQNLANFAPNVYVLKYLTGTRQMTEQVRLQTIRYLQVGYQRQLTYKRHDGSYSAFGEKDNTGSMWLTSFVLKSFAQARQFIYIDPKELLEAKEWIVSWQQQSGAFPPVGKIWNKDIQTGVDGDVALTAYVTVALIESGFEREEEEIAVMKAKEYLELRVHEDTDPYTASLVAYSLTLLNSDFAQDARDRLYDRAIHGKGVTYWSLRQKPENPLEDILSFEPGPEIAPLAPEAEINDDSLPAENTEENEELPPQNVIEEIPLPPDPEESPNIGLPEELAFILGDSLKQTVMSAEVEMTGFALLTFTYVENATVALPIVRWLSQKRNAIGGFSSTQDTCVALQALSQYAIFSYIGGVNLRVSLGCTTDGTVNCSKEFDLNNENDKVLQTANIPQLPTEVFVNANGVGCALLQVDVSYNIPSFNGEPAFYIKAGYHEIVDDVASKRRKRQSEGDGNLTVSQHARNYNLQACVRWLKDGSSNMAVLEFHLLTGFEADLESLERLLQNNPINLKRYEISGQAILFYFDEVYSTCNTCVRFLATRKFETATVKPRSVKIYDYYEPTYETEVLYPEVETEEIINDPGEEIGLSDVVDDVTLANESVEVPECRCRHDCQFSGPPVCGSDSVFYLNRCRMEAAACELETDIEERSKDFCEELQLEWGEETEEETTQEEAIFHPAMVMLGPPDDYYDSEISVSEDE